MVGKQVFAYIVPTFSLVKLYMYIAISNSKCIHNSNSNIYVRFYIDQMLLLDRKLQL